ncbi:hypothetical protein [Xanthomonas indica]|uniref:Uncharacterized protein n=1 Tax=Xanthomonas indica TaxID=2912242 RepID=A0AAU8IA15_9XANT|nr:hypothetical protein [Xanthomonas indica]MCI2259959.1 hypothetical protein [Xanthomonas indica]
MHPHRVLAPARVALLRPRSALAAAAGALLDRLQAGGLAAVEADQHRDPAVNHLRIARRDAPGPAAYAMPGHVDPALIGDVTAWVRALPASHGAIP